MSNSADIDAMQKLIAKQKLMIANRDRRIQFLEARIDAYSDERRSLKNKEADKARRNSSGRVVSEFFSTTYCNND